MLRTEKVLPKGSAELIFNLSGGGIFSSRAGEKARGLPSYFINGLNFRPVDLTVTQTQYFIGVQLNTFALKYLFDIPVEEFNDRIVEGSLLCKSLDHLWECLQESTSFTEQVAYILEWFRDRLKKCGFNELNQRMVSLHADREIIHLSVKGMSEKYNVSPRHLNLYRLFGNASGRPDSLSKVLIGASPDASVTILAYRNNLCKRILRPGPLCTNI